MSTTLSWVNPRTIAAATDLWGTSYGRYPIFFFSTDEPEVLHARLAAREYTHDDFDKTLNSTLNAAPSRLTLAESLTFNDEGNLRVVFPASHGEALYPAVDNKQVADDGVLRSFALVVSDARQYFENARYNNLSAFPFDTIPQLYLVGTVGDYQSGADLEFEAMDKWRIGRPLYIENNVLDTPFKILR